jgi:serine/threonine protein kinase
VEHVHNEKKLLQNMDSPFLLALKGSFKDNFFLYLVMEYVQGGELYHVLAKNGFIEENDARIYTSEVVCALSYLHSRKVIYRDLKPENILITSTGHIKLADFGFAKALSRLEQTFTLCGTPEYLAPEVIDQSGHSFACDWWTLGVLMYEMLVGHAPFHGNTPYNLYQNIMTEDVEFPSHIASDARSLISSLLIKDPQLRATETQIRAHPYFAGVVWENVEKLKMKPTYKPKIKNPLDASNFDKYPETDLAVDEKKTTDPDLFREF